MVEFSKENIQTALNAAVQDVMSKDANLLKIKSSERGIVHYDREFLRSGLATDRDGGGQRDSLGCLALGGLVDRAVSRDDAAIGGRPRHAVRSGQRNERIVDRRGDDDAVQHGTGEFTGMN